MLARPRSEKADSENGRIAPVFLTQPRFQRPRRCSTRLQALPAFLTAFFTAEAARSSSTRSALRSPGRRPPGARVTWSSASGVLASKTGGRWRQGALFPASSSRPWRPRSRRCRPESAGFMKLSSTAASTGNILSAATTARRSVGGPRQRAVSKKTARPVSFQNLSQVGGGLSRQSEPGAG
jgi:hypothetical protein